MRGLRRGRWQRDDLSPLSGQRVPAIGIKHIKTDLDSHAPKIALKDRKFPPRRRPAFQHIAALGGHRMDLAVDSHHTPLAVHQHRGIAVTQGRGRLPQEHRHDQVASMQLGACRNSGKHFLHPHHLLRQRVARAGKKGLREHDEVQPRGGKIHPRPRSHRLNQFVHPLEPFLQGLREDLVAADHCAEQDLPGKSGAAQCGRRAF